MFVQWRLTRAGKKTHKQGTWQAQISDFLRYHNLELDMEKEVLREKLTEIYQQSDKVARS